MTSTIDVLFIALKIVLIHSDALLSLLFLFISKSDLGNGFIFRYWWKANVSYIAKNSIIRKIRVIVGVLSLSWNIFLSLVHRFLMRYELDIERNGMKTLTKHYFTFNIAIEFNPFLKWDILGNDRSLGCPLSL